LTLKSGWGKAKMVSAVRHLLFLLICAVWLQGCPDFSALQEAHGPYQQSPSLDSLLDVTSQPSVDDARGQLPVDILLPSLDIALDSLEGFTLAAIEPASGDIQGKDVVMLVGSGFHDSMEVYFGEAKSSKPFVVNGNFATVETPPHWPGLVDVRLIGNEGEVATLPGGFEFTADLIVEALEPAIGPSAGGTPVIVTGTGFLAGCEVFFAGRKAPTTVLLDPFSLQTVSPPGDCGYVPVHVLCSEATGQLKEAYFYQGLPTIDSLWPAVVPEAGGTWVDLVGGNFTPAMSITVGEAKVPWYDQTFLAPGHVRFKVPPGIAGPADIALETTCGGNTWDDRLIFAGEGDPAAVELFGVVPGSHPACSGGFLTVALSSLGDPELLTIMAGGEVLQLLSYDEDLGVADVLLPPGPPGQTQIVVLVDEVEVLGTATIERLEVPSVKLISPASGHVGGGSEVAIEGCGFSAEVEVRFGSNVATNPEVFSESTIGVVTPPGSPGPTAVTVIGENGSASKAHGFTYLTDQPLLYLVSPHISSVAGGTYVRFYGAGMPPNAILSIGGIPCFDEHFVDGSLITARVPPNEAGTYDVQLEWPGGAAELLEAFTYFNPKSKKGGTWGGPIEEAVNVTVLDGGNGKGLAAAFVILGDELQSPHQGYTDEHGQITFSLPGLAGPVAVTAAKAGYSLYSVVHYDAANVTVYLYPVVLPSSGGGTYTPMQSYIAGRVYGLDKYVIVPPGDCSKKDVEGPLCDTCEGDADCIGEDPELEARCVEIGATGRYCVTACLQESDCPGEFSCAKVDFDFTGCWPRGGEKGIRCESSKKSMFGNPPNPGSGGTANSQDIYFINAVTGEMAVVCYGGHTDPDTYKFVPTVMGIKRHIIVLNGDVVKDQDIHLNIPLTREARISFHDLPQHPEGVRKPYLLLSLELGKEGYINPPTKPVWVEDGGYYRVPTLPAQMTGQLLGTTYSMYSSVQSDTPYSMPYAVRMVSEVESLFGDGIVHLDEAGVTFVQPPVEGDVVGISYRSDSDIYLATGKGELVHFDGIGWTPAGLPFTAQGFTVMVEDAAGHLWIGGAKGDIWHFNGTSWTWIDTGYSLAIRDLWAAGGKVIVVYSGFFAKVGDFGIEETVLAPAGQQLVAVWGADFEDLYFLSEAVVWNYSSDNWNALAVAASGEFTDLDGGSPDDVWVISNPGKVLRFEGDEYEEFEVDSSPYLTTVLARPDGKVFLGGVDGKLWKWQAGIFEMVDTGTLQDLLVVAADPTGKQVLAAGAQAYNLGPYMAYPHILKPENGGLFDFSTLQWDYWTEGAEADFHNIILSSDGGYSFWTMVVDGDVTEVKLPPIVQALGLNLYPDGGKRMNLTSSLNAEFNIDHYSPGDFSIYRKVSWAVDYVKFD
jgi:hypothetical protein